MKRASDHTSPTTIDQYIARFPPAVRAALKRVRTTIRKAVPGAEEVISYRIPAYRLHGRIVLYFAGWRHHYSIYPSNNRLVAALADELAPYEVSKGTIRFPLSRPVPVKLIERIARLRATEIAERQKPKGSAGRKRVTR